MSSDAGLAPRYRIRGFDGSLGDYLEHLEWFYRAIVGEAGIHLWGLPVRSAGAKAADGRDRAFWHLITDHSPAHTEESRTFSLARAAMLPQVWQLLEWLADGNLRAVWWEESYRGARYVRVASVDFSLVVVLRHTRTAFLLKSSWPVGASSRPSLLRQAQRSWNGGRSRRDSFLPGHADWRRPLNPPHTCPQARHHDRWEWW